MRVAFCVASHCNTTNLNLVFQANALDVPVVDLVPDKPILIVVLSQVVVVIAQCGHVLAIGRWIARRGSDIALAR